MDKSDAWRSVAQDLEISAAKEAVKAMRNLQAIIQCKAQICFGQSTKDNHCDDSIFIVDPGWDDYCLEASKLNRPVPLCPDARRALIMEYFVKINKKTRILELKRRNLKNTILISKAPMMQKKEDLRGDDLKHYESEIELMNLILIFIPNDIYNFMDSCTTTKAMWQRVEHLMRGTDSYDDIIDYLQQFEKLVNASRAKKLEKSHDPLALVAHMGSLSRTSSPYHVTYPFSVVDSDDDYQRNTDEAGVIITDKKNDFLFVDASRMEEIEELNANICLMARIQQENIDSDVGPSYDYAFLSENINTDWLDVFNDAIVHFITMVNIAGWKRVIGCAHLLFIQLVLGLAIERDKTIVDYVYETINLITSVQMWSDTNIRLSATSSIRRPSNRDSSFKNSVISNIKNSSKKVEVSDRTNKKPDVASKIWHWNVLIPCHDNWLAKYKLNMHSNVRRALFTTPRTVKSTFKDTTLVVSKTSVGQLCDGDLEVSFCSKTCYVQNLEGDDLLTGDRESNLYTIYIPDMAASSPVCLMSKAFSIKSWLWHRRLSHLIFGTINDLTKHDLVDGLSKFKYGKDHLCFACERGKSKKASYPPKLVPSYHSKLELLHMDLCGPM
nr:retrovirus-related Pol polyprotein from transposon TNT 1-94 [Tanacetum cinerariifolium]